MHWLHRFFLSARQLAAPSFGPSTGSIIFSMVLSIHSSFVPSAGASLGQAVGTAGVAAIGASRAPQATGYIGCFLVRTSKKSHKGELKVLKKCHTVSRTTCVPGGKSRTSGCREEAEAVSMRVR